MSSLTNWRHLSHGGHRYGRRYPVRYGRDPGLTRGRKIALAIAAVAAGGAAFFFSRRAKAAQAAVVPAQPAVPATPAGTPTAPAAPPVSTSADLGKVLTHDPPPAGDLNVFDRPDGTRVGGAEKDSLVSINSNDGTWANVTTHNTEGRYADVTGFVHAKFIAAPDAQALGGAAAQTAIDTLNQVASAFSGF